MAQVCGADDDCMCCQEVFEERKGKKGPVVAASLGRPRPALGHAKGPPRSPHSTPVPQGMGWSLIPRTGRKTEKADVAESGTAPERQIRPPGAAWWQRESERQVPARV